MRQGHALTVDTSKLTFMDGTGLRMLIKLGQAAEQRGQPVVVLNCSPAVQRLFDVATPDGIPGVELIKKD